MDIKTGALGLEGLGDMSFGTHFCLFYETEQDLIETLAFYFNGSLAKDDFCLWITSEPLEKASYVIRQAIPSADRYLEAGNLEIVSFRQWYWEDDVFDAARAIHALERKLSQALQKGHKGMRILGDEASLSDSDWDTFSIYEAMLDEHFANRPMSIVCAYSARTHNLAHILDMAQTHRFIAAKRNGNWEILEAPDLKHARVVAGRFTAEHNELEDKVQERIAHLSHVNQALQAEIIERKQAQDALTESQLRLQVALQAAQIGTGEWDLHANQVSLSEGLRRIYGFAPGTLTTTFAEFAERVHPEDRERFRSKLAEALTNETDFGLDYRVVWPDGSVRWVTGRAHIHRDELSKPIRIVGASMDITERKQAEEALHVSEARLQAAIDATDIVLWERDLPSGHIAWLGHHEKLLGFAPGELDDNTLGGFENRIHPEDIDGLRRVRQRALEEQSEYSHEYRVIWRDESIHWLRTQGRFIYSEAGQLVRLYGVVLDITERKQAESELQKNKEILQKIFDNVPVMITMVDKNGRFILTNRDFEHSLGWRLDQLKEQNPDMLAELYPDPQARLAVLDFAERADGRWEDFKTRAKDGRVINTSWAIVRLSDGSMIGVGKDNTERKRAEEDLRKSERVLREAEELGHTGSWEQDLLTGEIFNTEENLRLFFGDGYSKSVNFEDYAQVVYPDDREYVMQRRAELLEEEGPGDIEYRVVWPDGSVHVIFGRATVVRSEAGQPMRVYGTNVDITERKRAEEALREREKLLQLVLATLPVGVAVTDPADNIIVANPASKRIWGDVIISGSERRERSIGFWHDSGKRIAPEEWASLRALSKGETSLNELIDIETFDGVHKIIRNSSAPIRNSQGIIVGAVFVNEDVTERKRAEEETKHQAARAETLARIAARLNKQLDLEAVIHAVCQEAVDTFKVSQAVISLYDKKRDLLDYAGGVNILPQYRAKIESVSRAQFEEFDRTMGPILVVPDIQALPNVPSAEFTFELNVRTVVTADMRRDQELIGVLVLGVNGQVREFDPDELTLLKAISDQAAQAIANAQLLKTANEQREELRNLSARLVQVQEAERRAITTELHDRVGQNLTGLSIAIQNMKVSLSNQSHETVTAEINDAQKLLEDTTRHIRDIMAKLYLPELEDHGLAAALETYADRVASRANLDLVVDLPETPLPLSSDVRVALFRAAQEAISNVLKHADATQLEISLERENGRVRLRVEDNGRGFEPSPESPNETPSWGLKIMRERIESIGGKVWIESKPGEGTRVTFEIERFS